MEDIEYGTIKIHLDEIMKEQKLSLNKLSFRAEMQRTQLRKYCKNDIQRIDIAVLARICHALNCRIEDLIEYIPPHND